MSIFRDEQGKLSTARCLLWIWTLFCLYLIGFYWETIPQSVLAFLSAVLMALIAWSGGSRISQYLLPQIGNITNSIGQSINKQSSKTDITTKDNSDGSLASTDISEMRQIG